MLTKNKSVSPFSNLTKINDINDITLLFEQLFSANIRLKHFCLC